MLKTSWYKFKTHKMQVSFIEIGIPQKTSLKIFEFQCQLKNKLYVNPKV